ncbi:hypothetical protein HDU87_003054 [Geranomyces variabilis]|uniref:Fe2OG dioxygenase domain-containing protein n=1 Tax=Geranomyces variabilis TaxID=109894 RepID=A0AAD5TKI1_9FUNG|nr:hypothetical protein HDU87_003054 [Geranomyces variabilis]
MANSSVSGACDPDGPLLLPATQFDWEAPVPDNFRSIPVLDYNLVLSGVPEERALFMKQLGVVAKKIGFAYLINAPVDQQVVDRLIELLPQLFGLPKEKKLAICATKSPHFMGYLQTGHEVTVGKVDHREQFEFGPDRECKYQEGQPEYLKLKGPNQWPSEHDLPTFKDTVSKYIDQVSSASFKFIEDIAESIGMPRTAFDKYFDDAAREGCRIKILHYPAMDNFAEGEDDQGVGAHKDNWLTFLLQASNDVSGLEIQNNAGEWFVAPPMPNSFVVNFGIGIERITHGAVIATTHRARNPGKGQPNRFSVALFQEAAYTKSMEPWTDEERNLAGCAKTTEISAGTTYGRVSDALPHSMPFDNVGEATLWNRIRSHPDIGYNHYSADFVKRVLEEGPNSHPLAAEIAAKVGARGYAQASRPSTPTPNVTPSESPAVSPSAHTHTSSPASIASGGTTLHSESNKSVGMFPQSKISLLEEKLALLSCGDEPAVRVYAVAEPGRNAALVVEKGEIEKDIIAKNRMLANKLEVSQSAYKGMTANSPLMQGLDRASKNSYDPVTNPRGIINLGTAENRVMASAVADKRFDPSMLQYGCFYGSLRLRTAIAKTLNKHFRALTPLTESNVTVLAGCSAAISAMFSSLCNPGDTVLIATPYYGGFDWDVCLSSGASLIKVHTAAPDFALSPELFEAAYAAASVAPRVLLITNPQNPQGTTISAATLLALLEWAAEKQLHVVVDEIYGLSVYAETPCEFVSVLALPVPDPARTHVVWGPSKDFCLNGLRVGACVSFNDNLQSAMRSIAILSNIAVNTDNLFARLLEDSEWVARFIDENCGVLRALYERTTVALDRIGVRYLKSNSGFFIWMDLSPWLTAHPKASAAESEMMLWEEFLEHGVYLAPGCAFSAPVPGYFRLGFAVEWEILEVALTRMSEVLST